MFKRALAVILMLVIMLLFSVTAFAGSEPSYKPTTTGEAWVKEVRAVMENYSPDIYKMFELISVDDSAINENISKFYDDGKPRTNGSTLGRPYAHVLEGYATTFF